MKYFSTFSGIGGFEIPLQEAGHECVGYSEFDPSCGAQITDPKDVEEKIKCNGYHTAVEWNKSKCDTCGKIKTQYAIEVYEKHFNHTNYGDIKKINWDKTPDFDLFVGGTPCQDMSIAGKRKGLKGERSGLFYDYVTALEQKKPKYFVWENVKGALSSNKGWDFAEVLNSFSEAGYDVQWEVLNSKNFGVPQNRERIFVIGSRGTSRPEVFPFGETDEEDTRHAGEDLSYCLDANYHKGTNTLEKGRRQLIQQLNQPTHSNDRIYGTDGLSPTLNTAQGGNRQPFVAINTEKSSRNMSGMSYETTSNRRKEERIQETQEKRYGAIRRLTPVEAARLQGFPDNWHEGLSDTQAYKVYGNAVTVNVIRSIIGRL